MNVLFRKTVCSVVTVVFGWGQVAFNYAVASDVAEKVADGTDSSDTTDKPTGTIEDYGKSVNQLGKDLAGKYRDTAPTWNGTSIGIQVGTETINIDKDSLVPKADGSHIKYNVTQDEIDKQKELWSDSLEMSDKGTEKKDALFQDASSDSPSVEGDVYSILIEQARHPRDDLSKDSAFQKSQDILNNLKNEIESVVNCKNDVSLASSGSYKHITDIQTCQQVVDRSSSCTVDHNYSAGIISYVGGAANIQGCGEGCTTMWLGDPSDQNYKAGKNSCVLYKSNIDFMISNAQAITKVELSDIYWDDQMQIYFGQEEGNEVKLLQLPYSETFVPQYDEHPDVPPVFTYPGPFSGAAHTSCQQKISWSWKTKLDITKYFKESDPSKPYRFRIRTAVQDNGEGYARMTVYYDPSKIVTSDEWTPSSCVDSIKGWEDGYASGSIKCIRMPALTSDGCTWINEAKVCPNNFATPPLPGINALCKQVEVKTNYNFYKGDTGCWKALLGFDDNGDPQYEEICGGENLGGNLDTCRELEDKGCTFVSSECTEGMKGASGTCYVNDVKYDCGKDVKVGNDVLVSKYNCQGISCAGENCIDAEQTTNKNFGKISALLQMADYASEDMSCEGLDEDGKPTQTHDVLCTIFGGTAGDCKIAVGGWQDCCDSPQSAGLSAYISMTMAAKGAHQATANLAKYGTDWGVTALKNGSTTIPDGAQTIYNIGSQYTQAIGNALDVVSEGTGYLGKAVSSVFDSITGMYDAAKKAVSELINEIFGEVIKQIKKYLMDLLGEILEKTGLSTIIGGGTGAGGATGGAIAAEGMAAYAAAAFAVVSWIYLIYQVANLIVNIIYKCEEEEYELDAKRDAKNCHYVGSYCKSKTLGMCVVKKKVYCCFQSPLSRIVNEQIRATQPEVLQYGGESGWGTPKNPICEGVPMEKIDKINWDIIDLSEWEGMVVETNNIAQTDEQLTLEQLTGKGNTHLNFYGDGKKNTQSRSKARSGYTHAKSTQREDALDRNEQALQGQDVDQLRIQMGKCYPMYVGGRVTVGGDCIETGTTPITCRDHGHIVSCDSIARDNMLNDLLGNDKKSNEEYWVDKKICFDQGIAVDCSKLWDDKLYKDVLEDYASIIGGTTYKERYVCLDKSGGQTTEICENAMLQQGCPCIKGDFVCQEGNKIIPCSEIGTTMSECECLKGACKSECQYGGIPTSQLENPSHVNTVETCPYGIDYKK